MISKPPILVVIGNRVSLRRVGRQWRGLCPFHSEKTPSFYVHEEKGFYCFGCGESGDVIGFIMKLDGLTFPEACRALGIEGKRKSRPTLTTSRKRAAELALAWVNEQRAKLNVMIADAMEQRDIADEIGDFNLAEIFDRQLIALREFYDLLDYPEGAAELLAMHASIENITNGVGVTL